MSQELFMRGLFSGILSLMLAWIVFSRYDEEVGNEVTNREGPRYLPYIPGILLPMFLLSAAILSGVFYGFKGAARFTLSMCFGIFLHISIYYFILLLLLPILRRFICARVCAMLWMIPNYLYITNQSFMELPSPKLVFSASGNLAWLLFILWFMGFFTVLVLKIAEHLTFRRQILKAAAAVADPEVLYIWGKILEQAQIKKPKFKLVTSNAVNMPLSVGLFKGTTKVILPARQYSLEELELILKHEIIHISREDSSGKFFLIFCTAMCWFNPLMWIAMNKCAEDMELSCDETVLLNAGEAERQKYASLLLNTAGDGRGFTTCLSPSADTMRYRLKNIVKPAKRRSGALAVGLIFFLLCMTSGYIALSYGGKSGAEIIYSSGDASQYTLQHVSKGKNYYTDFEILDEEAFHRYLSELTLSELTGNYSFSDSSEQCTYILNTPDGTLGIILFDNAIKLAPIGNSREADYYYIEEGVDWEYLGTLITPIPQNREMPS